MMRVTVMVVLAVRMLVRIINGNSILTHISNRCASNASRTHGNNSSFGINIRDQTP